MENLNFPDIFRKFQKLPMALYGLSSGTQEMLEQMDDTFNIVGLLDGYREEGTIYGKQIISLNEAVQNRVEMIIVVARPSSRRIIVNRIREVCMEHGIRLYDVNGNDLLVSHSGSRASYAEQGIRREVLLEKIDQSEVISFDVFDTLITRAVLYPTDVFELVEQKVMAKYGQGFEFSEKRQAAERSLSQTGVPAIGDIYHELEGQIPLSREELDEVQAMEWETEQRVILPRYEMCRIFQYALSKQKKVYLVSDMYYTEAQLAPMLYRLGITGYEKLIVSCEYGTTKAQQLFRVLKEEAEADTYLHIGDNYLADVKSAERNGIFGIQIKSGIDLFDSAYWSEHFGTLNTLSDRVKQGMFISQIFNSPFVLSQGEISIKNPYDFGYLLLAPILTDYTMWLYGKLIEARETTVLFCARDGFLMKRLFDILLERRGNVEQNINTIYFLTSRISAVGASLFQEQDILHAAQIDFCGSFRQLLKTRFSLVDEEISEADCDVAAPMQAVLKYKNLILDRAQENRKRYLKYIAGLQLSGEKAAFFDFVSSGTCQAAIEKIMGQKMQGYYFIRVEDDYYEKKRLDIIPFYERNDCAGRIYEDYFILENILTSPMPSLKGFDEEGRPQYPEEKRSSEEISFINEVHEGIVRYFEQYLDILQDIDCGQGRRCSEEILGLLHKIPIENDVFNHMVWEDSFYSRRVDIKELM